MLPKTILKLPSFWLFKWSCVIIATLARAAPIQRAIEAGDAETGVSAMLMEEGLDTGPLVGASRN